MWYIDKTIGCKENPGYQDTGNGAIAMYEVHPEFPGVRRVTVKSYCGRNHDNCVYYTRGGSRYDELPGR